MPRKRKPQAASDGDTPLTPITAKERRKLDELIKKKYDRFRRRYPEIHGKVVDFITHSIEDGTLYFIHRAFQGQDGFFAPLRVRHVRCWCRLL
jgi:hypothetical protein